MKFLTKEIEGIMRNAKDNKRWDERYMNGWNIDNYMWFSVKVPLFDLQGICYVLWLGMK